MEERECKMTMTDEEREMVPGGGGVTKGRVTAITNNLYNLSYLYTITSITLLAVVNTAHIER